MHKSGRPPKYDSAETLEDEVEKYFLQFTSVKTAQEIVAGAKIEEPMFGELRPTITGLCLFLGFESRQSFYDLQKQEIFSYTIKRARARIENVYEQMLSTKHSTGAIFALKNFEWTDKQEIEHSSSIEKPFILQVLPDKDI